MNFLTDEKQKELKAQHRTERDGRIRDRIKAILLSNKGWSIKKIAEALLIDEMTVSRHLDEFSESQKLKPENGGSLSLLSIQQTEELIQHLENHTYVKVKDICQYVATTYCVTYTISGMTKWMHDNEFSFKKPKKVPAKANEEKQKAFVEIYNNLVATTPSNEPILHIDAVHPTMATKESYGWIRTGKDKIIATNASRTRMNIAGALHLPTLDVIQENFDTINGTNINALLRKVRETYKNAPNIHIIPIAFEGIAFIKK
jgi:transposase